MKESELQAMVFRELTKDPRVRIFRNNTALGFAGRIIDRSSSTITLLNPYPIHAGLFTGSGDAIGWVTCNGVAVFTSLEFKSPTGRASPAQITWRDAVIRAGGIAGIVRSVDEARGLVL